MDGDGKAAHFCRPEHMVKQIAAAGFFHFYNGDAGDFIVGQNFLQPCGNVKIRRRTTNQRKLSSGQLIMEAGTGKGAAIRCDQQVGVMEIGRNLRNLPQFNRPLRKVAGLIRKHLLIVILIVFPGIKDI